MMVGSGYTLAELRDLGLKLKPHWKPFNTKHPPECVLLAPGFKEKPDLWIKPWNSTIVQVRAAEIIVSDKYKTGCTLRFPRVEKVRDDKDWFDCMTVDELEQLKSMASGKLTHAHFDDSEAQPSSKKRRVASSRIERPRGVASQFRQTDITDVQEVSKMFQGKEFCVVNGPRELPKDELERKIAEHGGTFVQNPGPDTFCVLVNKKIVRANNIISTGLYDVVKTEWIQQCLSAGECLPFSPKYMMHVSPTTATKFAELYDQFGDSYTEDATDESLKTVFKKVQENCGSDIPISTEEIALMEERYFPDESPRGLFRQYKFYLDKYREIGNPSTAIDTSSLDLVGLEIRLYGGTVVDTFTEDVTHVVIDRRDSSRVSRLRTVERSHRCKHHFVTSDWVTDSIECEFLKNERLYEPNV